MIDEDIFAGEVVVGVPEQADEYARKAPGHQDSNGDHCAGQQPRPRGGWHHRTVPPTRPGPILLDGRTEAMLKFVITSGSTGLAWRRHGAGWRAGLSSVTPFRHPALDSSWVSEADVEVVTVRERRRHGDHAELRLARDGAVELRAGAGGVVPLHVVADGDRLVGSWDPADLAGLVGSQLSPVAVARLLTRRHRYSHATVFPAMTRITAGSHAVWTPGSGLRLRYPQPAHHVLRPRLLRAGADPVAGFTGLFDQVTADVLSGTRDVVVAVELSGGLDSTNVAVSAAAAHRGALVGGGIDVHGRTGRAQRRRRRLISTHLQLPVEAVSAIGHLPLTLDGPRTHCRPHQPDGDVYQEAFDALRAKLRHAGARSVLTGYGGDEIMSRTPTERAAPLPNRPPPPWLAERARAALADVDDDCSPVTAVALPTLLVFAARNPAYLRAGLWPVAPYTDPRVSHFGRSLPVEWRTGKQLLRHRLARTGFPRAVTHPNRRESFGATMHLALRRHGVPLLTAMLDQSPLVAHDLVRRDIIDQLRRRARWGLPLPPLVFDMLALDVAIRSMTSTAPAKTTAADPPSFEEPCAPSPLPA